MESNDKRCPSCHALAAEVERLKNSLPLILGRHENRAREAAGQVYRHKLDDESEIGVVEVQRVIAALTMAYADLDNALAERDSIAKQMVPSNESRADVAIAAGEVVLHEGNADPDDMMSGFRAEQHPLTALIKHDITRMMTNAAHKAWAAGWESATGRDILNPPEPWEPSDVLRCQSADAHNIANEMMDIRCGERDVMGAFDKSSKESLVAIAEAADLLVEGKNPNEAWAMLLTALAAARDYRAEDDENAEGKIGTNIDTPPDHELLDWLESNMFNRHWDGCLDHLSTWHMAGPYRHVLAKMKGGTLRDAIRSAMKNE